MMRPNIIFSSLELTKYVQRTLEYIPQMSITLRINPHFDLQMSIFQNFPGDADP